MHAAYYLTLSHAWSCYFVHICIHKTIHANRHQITTSSNNLIQCWTEKILWKMRDFVGKVGSNRSTKYFRKKSSWLLWSSKSSFPIWIVKIGSKADNQTDAWMAISATNVCSFACVCIWRWRRRYNVHLFRLYVSISLVWTIYTYTYTHIHRQRERESTRNTGRFSAKHPTNVQFTEKYGCVWLSY